MATQVLAVAWALLSATVYATPVRPLSSRQPTNISGFTYKGCYTEAMSQRALTGNSYFDDNMTLEKCAAACAAFPSFGVEYGRECYVSTCLEPHEYFILTFCVCSVVPN